MVCVAVRGIQRGRMMWTQREECDREERVSGETSVMVCVAVRGIQHGRMM
jgi:hypothetical protein